MNLVNSPTLRTYGTRGWIGFVIFVTYLSYLQHDFKKVVTISIYLYPLNEFADTYSNLQKEAEGQKK